MSPVAGESAELDPASIAIVAKRVRQLSIHVGVAVLGTVLGVIALVGGATPVIALLVMLALTFVALALDLRGWRGAGEVWAGRADPARLRNLSLWSLAFGVPALVGILIVTLLVLVPPLARLVGAVLRHWPGSSSSWGLHAFGSLRWTDPFVVGALVACVVASIGASTLSLQIRRRASS